MTWTTGLWTGNEDRFAGQTSRSTISSTSSLSLSGGKEWRRPTAVRECHDSMGTRPLEYYRRQEKTSLFMLNACAYMPVCLYYIPKLFHVTGETRTKSIDHQPSTQEPTRAIHKLEYYREYPGFSMYPQDGSWIRGKITKSHSLSILSIIHDWIRDQYD